jgi:hypothetical protein
LRTLAGYKRANGAMFLTHSGRCYRGLLHLRVIQQPGRT